jgi:hypothetical protein
MDKKRGLISEKIISKPRGPRKNASFANKSLRAAPVYAESESRGERNAVKNRFHIRAVKPWQKVFQFDAYRRFDARAIKYYSFHSCCHAGGAAL